MEQEIKGVIEGSFNTGIIEQGVIYDFHFAENVLYYLIIPLSIGIFKCKVASLGHPEVYESPPFCDECG